MTDSPMEVRLSPLWKKIYQPKNTEAECHTPWRNHRKKLEKDILLFMAFIL